MNYQSQLRTQTRMNNQYSTKFQGRKLDTDLYSLNFSLENKQLDRLSQTSTNFWTEQKPKRSLIFDPPSITISEVASSISRIQANLDKFKFNTEEKTSRFDQLNDKINSHLKKIQQFLSKNDNTENTRELSAEPLKQQQSSLEQPTVAPESRAYSYLPIKNKKPQSVNAQSSALRNSRNGLQHFTAFSNYLFSNGRHCPLKLKQYLKQLKTDLADRQSAILRLTGSTSFWQNVWLGPKGLSKPKTLVLDLDETLIHSSFDPRNKMQIAEPRLNCTFGFRPFLKEFLLKCNDLFEIVVFTASEETYANTIVNRIKELCNYKITIKKILDRKFINSLGQKDLSILKDRELKDIIFIDNLALSFANGQLNNGIPILEWTGDSRDKELKKILPFLSHCKKCNDAREPIKERFNLESFMSQAIQWETIDTDLFRTPIGGKNHF